MTGIRVLVVDDHPFYREGVKSMAPLIDPGIEVIGEAGDGETALQLAAELQPDVVLMDLNLPRMNGIEAARMLRRAHPQIAVLVLTMLDDESVVAAIEAGAGGYLLKDASVDDVCRGIRSVARGELVVAPTAASRLLAGLRQASGLDVAFPQLTAREHDILALLAEDASTDAIARRLFLTPKTVRNYVSAVLLKLDAPTREAAAARARAALADRR